MNLLIDISTFRYNLPPKVYLTCRQRIFVSLKNYEVLELSTICLQRFSREPRKRLIFPFHHLRKSWYPLLSFGISVTISLPSSRRNTDESFIEILLKEYEYYDWWKRCYNSASTKLSPSQNCIDTFIF